ncbi:MAG TPA: VapC toxin family PIN domain ribonuclease [Usitatibacteraceae bacterium]|nr:VapC toxin family PIN domain ribonuclease [Usitatibacteraceae bacterium]
MVIADTGFFLALLWHKDGSHARALDLYRNIDEGLVTTWPVLTETTHLLSRGNNAHLSSGLLRACEAGEFRIAAQTSDACKRMAALMDKYADLPMDLADASLVVLAEEMGSGRILSTDRRDFKSYRWKNRKPFTNLMFPDD